MELAIVLAYLFDKISLLLMEGTFELKIFF
jgi:hypothetical protein